MTRYALGDVQGCYAELRTLLDKLNFSADRDRLWFVGDLVNRGPESLQVLRFVRSLGAGAVVVLGNHDLHLLAVARGTRRKRGSDTLDAVLAAPDRDALLEWLAACPLAYCEQSAGRTDLLVHAGVVPQWTVAETLRLAGEVQARLRDNAAEIFDHMYGDEPDRWSDTLAGMDRVRFVINVLTRIRVCTADGRVDLKLKGKPPAASPFKPWFDLERPTRTARVIFGHWSALGLVQRNGVVGLDTGCVWGNALTAFDLDSERPPVAVPCSGYQVPDE